MDLTAALWIFVTAASLVFAADAAVERVTRLRRAPAFARQPVARFAALMLLFSLACGGVALYEILT